MMFSYGFYEEWIQQQKKLWEVLCGNESEIFIMHSQCQYLQAMCS